MAKTLFAPFLDVTVNPLWSDWENYPQGRPDPIYSEAAIRMGIDEVYLSFLTASPDNQACWAGQSTLPISWAQPLAKELVDGNVKVGVSFGGAANYDISKVMTEAQLVSVYQQVIQQLGASHLDFDFENGHYDAEKAFAAVAKVKASNKDLTLSLTVPTMPFGLTGVGLSLVKQSLDAGLEMTVNGMAMDYYSPDYQDMGKGAVMAAQNIKQQLAQYYPNLTDEQLYAKTQVTPMIGINDDQTTFSFDDVKVLTDFAKASGLSRLSIWSLSRDHPGGSVWAEPDRSGYPAQTKDFEFSQKFIDGLK